MAFQYEQLIVYQRAVQYDQIATKNIRYVRKHDPNLADHIRRSGNSLLTNLAEAGSEDRPSMKANGYRVCKKEAEELGTAWEKALREGWAPKQAIENMLALLREVVLMLLGLIRRFDQ